mmetsp:Transcript_27916/g.48866  ORF Transcript_27916/g.48866 Transcript_27916/m.48866 type:complete len:229 (+) Transcript_27916:78-764(+)
MRVASNVAQPMSIWRAARNGKSASDMLALVHSARSSRDRGPCRLICAHPPVTSVTQAKPKRLWSTMARCRRLSTCRWAVSVATTRKLPSPPSSGAGPSLVMVRSASNVPRAWSSCVYVIVPCSPSTFAVARRSSSRPAAGPCTRNLLMNDMSISATPRRHAACSAAQLSNQWCRPHESCPTSAGCAAVAYQSAASHPDTSRKHAPRAASRSCSGERRTWRTLRGSRCG